LVHQPISVLSISILTEITINHRLEIKIPPFYFTYLL